MRGLLMSCRFLRQAIWSNSIRTMQSAVPSTFHEESSVLKPPKDVFDMKELDKEKFSTHISFPCLKIDARLTSRLTNAKTIRSAILNGKRLMIKQIQPDPNDSSKRIILFDPDVIKDEDNEKKQEVLALAAEVMDVPREDLRFECIDQLITFENWSMSTCFRAVMPYCYSGYTQTGHIIHCSFTDEILPYKRVLAQILLAKIKGCRTVVMKSNIITSVYRNLDLELLAGEKDYITQQKESGLTFKMDFSTVYWNSRLSHEHERVIQKFDGNSLVYDACAGIGPFVLPAVRAKHPRVTMANDLNAESVRWLRENIKINKINENWIQVFNEDGCDFLRGPVADSIVENILKDAATLKERAENEKLPEAQRDYSKLELISGVHVIMNLPAFAVNFLPTFRGLLRNRFPDNRLPDGVNFSFIVYCYLFTKSSVDVEDAFFERQARQMVKEKLDYEGVEILNAHNVRCVSSRKFMFCMELKLPWELLLAERNENNEWKPLNQPDAVDLHEDEDENESVKEDGDKNGSQPDQPEAKRVKLSEK